MADNVVGGSKRLFCGHCQDYVSKTVYHQHRRLYFDVGSKKWSSTRVYFSEEDAESFTPTTNDQALLATSQDNLDYDDIFDANVDFTECEYESQTNSITDASSDTSSDEEFELCEFNELSSDEEEENVPDDSEYSGIIKLYTFFLLTFQSTFHVSDAAMTVMFLFLSMFLTLVSKNLASGNLKTLASKLPRSVKAAKIFLSIQYNFERYACCQKCFSVYMLDHSGSLNGSAAQQCPHIKFPEHPMEHYRKPCNASLLKVVKTPLHKSILYPKLTYCYRSVTQYLKELLMRPGFIGKCESWRKRNVTPGTLKDVYDGKVWNEFLKYEDKPFLSLPFNYALHLNVDWFQPFEHTQHSEGAVYLTILNLPREERYCQENVMVIGIIPGPKEPKLNINSFLRPFVKEMLSLWEGIIMKTEKNVEVLVRAALLCVGCDIPAARKVCGFVGHGGYKGCSKCLLSFPTKEFGQKADYTNTNMNDWIPRTKALQKKKATDHKNCTTRAEQKAIEREFGKRYSVLDVLPYFDPPRMCIIDPMHNLLLGTSKHMMETWKELNLVSAKDYSTILSRISEFTTPNDVGRLPSRAKIMSGFSGFTAEEWKNWTLFFSLCSLKEVLPWRHYQCWHLFVKACFLLCRRTITYTEVNQAHVLIMEFYSEVVALYGNKCCTMNIHLHGHLKECIEDYGPVYSFWLFAFERLNGILGSYPTNNRNISVQLMHHFLDSQMFSSCNWPKDHAQEFLPVIEKFKYHKGSLQQTTVETAISASFTSDILPLPPVKEDSFNSEELSFLKKMVGFDVLMLYKKTGAIQIKNFVLGSKASKHSRSSLVLTKSLNLSSLSLSEILFFAQCTTVLPDGTTTTFWIAFINTYMEHQCKLWFGSPVQVWTTTPSAHSFIPISAIKSRVSYSKLKVDFGSIIGEEIVLIVVPLESNTM